MTSDALLKNVNPERLVPARVIAHRAAQHLTKAARANLEAKPDDSHSNLGWDSTQNAFLTHPLDGWFVGLSLSPLRIFLSEGNEVREDLHLNGVSDTEVGIWLDARLTSRGLSAGSVIDLPYDLPAEVAGIDSYHEVEHEQALGALAGWFDVSANTLEKIVSDNTDIKPGPSPVRCWPHHFDIATYVSLEVGDPETARGIGVGLSPGDEGYNEPYFYINPWPYLDKDNLPDVVKPGHWHIDGYVGLIATASELIDAEDIQSAITRFVQQSFATAKAAQGM